MLGFSLWIYAALIVGLAVGLLAGGWCASLKHAALRDEITALRRRLPRWAWDEAPSELSHGSAPFFPQDAGPWLSRWRSGCSVDSAGAESPHAEASAGSRLH